MAELLYAQFKALTARSYGGTLTAAEHEALAGDYAALFARANAALDSGAQAHHVARECLNWRDHHAHRAYMMARRASAA